jgi:ParB family chromosome partitioning protein
VKAKRLGRGLSGLLNRTEEADLDPVPLPVREREMMLPPPAGPLPPSTAATDGPSRKVAVGAIRPNPFQPRTTFRPEALEELQASIRAHGILQPIVVRRSPTGYEVVAGERRLRAAQALGMAEVPVVVREATDEEMQTLALVENLQREDLNAMEQARALRAMMGNFGLTQELVAERVGKARTTIANIVRLLELPPEIQRLVEEGALSGAHARALLAARGDERRITLARASVQEGLSVREFERRAADGPTIGKKRAPSDPFIADLEDRIRKALAAPVKIRAGRKGGTIEIWYQDAGDLDRLLEAWKA